MSWPELTETQAHIVKGCLKGALRGGAVGAAAAVASGTAVVITTPAWLPWIGGSMLIAGSTLAAWTAAGSAAGALTGGAGAYARLKKQNRLFRKTFGKCRTR